MPATPQEIYQRYLRAGPLTQNADAVAEMFAVDGVFEAPLVPVGRAFPRRPEGREEMREAQVEMSGPDWRLLCVAAMESFEDACTYR